MGMEFDPMGMELDQTPMDLFVQIPIVVFLPDLGLKLGLAQNS
jgi:hypothetical protein